jgi:hypothetical protein
MNMLELHEQEKGEKAAVKTYSYRGQTIWVINDHVYWMEQFKPFGHMAKAVDAIDLYLDTKLENANDFFEAYKDILPLTLSVFIPCLAAANVHKMNPHILEEVT